MKGHSQLDGGVRVGGEKRRRSVCSSFFFCPLSSRPWLGGGGRWTALDINIDLNDELGGGSAAAFDSRVTPGNPGGNVSIEDGED